MVRNTGSNRSKGKSGGEDKNSRLSISIDALIKSLPGFAGQRLARAAEQSSNILEVILKAPEYMEQVGKAGRYLQDMRKVAGLTLDDLAKAVDLENPEILRAIEEGRSPLTLDILFRLASFYSRNDPITFMLNFTKDNAPWLWQILRLTGVEKLLITMERELKFINIYRSRELARQMDDPEFDRLLKFMHNAFDLALDFIEPTQPEKPTPPAKKAAQAEKLKAPQKAAPKPKGPTTPPKKATTKAGAKRTPTPQPKTAPARKLVKVKGARTTQKP